MKKNYMSPFAGPASRITAESVTNKPTVNVEALNHNVKLTITDAHLKRLGIVLAPADARALGWKLIEAAGK